MTSPVTFKVSEKNRAIYKIDGTRVVIAPLDAEELIQLDGIASGSLFAWNVRQSLGKTKVNKAIGSSIQDSDEHKNFLLFHNGLTILCESITLREDDITIAGYTVVNGCQSLTSLYEHRDHLSGELKLLSRLIELDPDSPLAIKITHNTNNQNPISARDLQSNSILQRRLQKEFETSYPGEFFYRIKRGETTNVPNVVDNQEAARILLAFDKEQPWACHQTYKLFDELYTDIFARPEVTADRIVALWSVYDAVEAKISELNNELMSGYTLTKFFMLFLLRQALQHDELGQEFVREPGLFLGEPDGYERIQKVAERILSDLIIDLNAEMEKREGEGDPIDYKRELKSPNPVRTIVRNVISPYQMAVSRGRATSFADEWKSSAPEVG